ncbi:MAG: TlpA family protein disulfide reductase [Candidatus Solibacter usitatus]|nr:TlpA family protein disulfide reductase [Candidatus Solibacter usitatus]
MAVKSGKGMLPAGAKAPGFRLKGVDGSDHALDQLISTGPVLLAFFKVSCPVCQFTFPFLERARNGEIDIYGISQDGEKQTREFQRAFGVTFPVLLDQASEGYQASNGFSITHVPSMFLVTPGGEISSSWTGWSKASMKAFGEKTGETVVMEGEDVPDLRPG